MLEKFNLQLFNSEGGEAAGTTSPDPGNAGGAAAESGAEKVVLDEHGGVRLVRDERHASEVDEEEEGASQIEGAGKNEADPAAGDKGTPAGEQALYTPDELRITPIENINPQRLPPAMQEIYRAMQAPITRKNMELAESLKAVREFVEQAGRQPELQQPKVSEAEFYQRLDTALLHEVAKRFNQDPEQLVEAGYDRLPPPMKLAYTRIHGEWEREAQHVLEERQAERQREIAFQTTAASLENELRGLDADAYAAFEASIRAEEMPLKEIKAIREAIAKGDRKAVADIFEGHRAAFHARKNGIRTGEKRFPARLEGAGSGGQTESKAAIDYSELGKLKSFDDKMVWLRRHNIKP